MSADDDDEDFASFEAAEVEAMREVGRWALAAAIGRAAAAFAVIEAQYLAAAALHTATVDDMALARDALGPGATDLMPLDRYLAQHLHGMPRRSFYRALKAGELPGVSVVRLRRRTYAVVWRESRPVPKNGKSGTPDPPGVPDTANSGTPAPFIVPNAVATIATLPPNKRK